MKIWIRYLTGDGTRKMLLFTDGEPLPESPHLFFLLSIRICESAQITFNGARYRDSIFKMTSLELSMPHVRLGTKAHLTPRFLTLIAPGFRLKVKTGQSIRELFCGQLGISDDYFENRIQTIFLDGKAVDNTDAAWVEDGSRLALSAAMPGLVGATFRKGGRYASFRGTISYSKSKESIAGGDGEITLKFFNMIARELGPAFLQKGVIVEGHSFRNFLLSNSEELKTACISIHLNDEKTDLAGLLEMNWENEQVFLQVTSEKSC